MSTGDEREPRRARGPMTTEERYDLARPSGELMSDVPWDGVVVSPDRMTSQEFLGTLLG